MKKFATMAAAGVSALGIVAVGATPAFASGDYFNTGGVNIRTCAYTSCSAVGAGYPGQSVTVHSIVYGQMVDCTGKYAGLDTSAWAYLTDNTTGRTGYSSECYVD